MSANSYLSNICQRLTEMTFCFHCTLKVSKHLAESVCEQSGGRRISDLAQQCPFTSAPCQTHGFSSWCGYLTTSFSAKLRLLGQTSICFWHFQHFKATSTLQGWNFNCCKYSGALGCFFVLKFYLLSRLCFDVFIFSLKENLYYNNSYTVISLILHTNACTWKHSEPATLWY